MVADLQALGQLEMAMFSRKVISNIVEVSFFAILDYQRVHLKDCHFEPSEYLLLCPRQRFHRHGLAASAALFRIESSREQLKPFASYERLPTIMEMQPTRMPDAPWMYNKSHHLIADGNIRRREL